MAILPIIKYIPSGGLAPIYPSTITSITNIQKNTLYNGANPPEGMYLIIGRIATIYYFVHFILIMPLLGFKEKTNPLPISISDPVLGNEDKLSSEKTVNNR